MDTDTLVENQIDDGQKLLMELVRSGFDVRVACWIKPSEEGRWFLYIASNAVDEKGPAAAYRQAYTLLRSIEAPWVSMSTVKLISPANPLARDVLEFQRQHPGNIPTQVMGFTYLGNMGIEGAYIYPPQKAECGDLGRSQPGEMSEAPVKP